MSFIMSMKVAVALLLLCNLQLCQASVGMRVSGPFVRPAMRLRGGGWGNGQGQQEAPAQESQALEVAHQQPAPEPAAPPQPSLLGHAVEYALAGSFDGIRSGLGQAVGGEMARCASGILQQGISGTGMAFAHVWNKLPFLPKKRAAICEQQPMQAQGQQSDPIVPQTGVCVCFVTVPSDEVASMLTDLLVQSGLVACVNQLQGVTSTYVWEGKVQRDNESLLILKTNKEQVATVAAVIKEKHPYDNPEFICMNVEAGLPDYLGWIRSLLNRPQM